MSRNRYFLSVLMFMAILCILVVPARAAVGHDVKTDAIRLGHSLAKGAKNISKDTMHESKGGFEGFTGKARKAWGNLKHGLKDTWHGIWDDTKQSGHVIGTTAIKTGKDVANRTKKSGHEIKQGIETILK